MLSSYWDTSAFLLSYDGSGGWFDHVAPPQVDENGYGLQGSGAAGEPLRAARAWSTTPSWIPPAR